jgi:predicted nucleic acid-binding protein
VTYLVDTNVISALGPTRKDRPAAVVEWLDRASPEIYLSAVTSAEIREGVAKASREGATRKAEALREWWDAVEHLYADRILPFDLVAAGIAGPMADRARAAGQSPGFADIAIAATAQGHGLTILTGNVRHFRALYARILNPLDGPLPPLTSAAP